MDTFEEFAKEARFENVSCNTQGCRDCGNFVPRLYHMNGPTQGICKKMIEFGISGVTITVQSGHDVSVVVDGLSRFLRGYDKMSRDEINRFLNSYDWENQRTYSIAQNSCKFHR